MKRSKVIGEKEADLFIENQAAKIDLPPFPLRADQDSGQGMTEGIFTGKKLSHYINSAGVDYTGARRIINGTDQQQLIASYAQKFEVILKSSAEEASAP